MSKKGGSVYVPDAAATAAAQTKSNIDTATANQKLNMVNSYGPDGSVTYAADPSAPGGYSMNTNLSPTQQAIYNQSNQAQQGALGVANQQIGRVGDALGAGLSPNTGALSYGVSPTAMQTSLGQQGNITGSFNQGQGVQGSAGSADPMAYGFNPGQQVQGHVNPNSFGDPAVQQQVNAMYGQATSRLDPQWQQQQTAFDSQMAAQGITPGSSAYQTAMDNFNRSKNDAYGSAYNSAVASGQQEQQNLYGQNLSAGQFANQAAGQQYAQNQGQSAFYNNAATQQLQNQVTSGTFNNAAAAQQYAQNANTAQFQNTAQQQAYDQSLQSGQFANNANNTQFNQNLQAASLNNAAQGQAFQQQAYSQQLPINEFNALMSSGQVAMPQGIGYTPSQVANTDVIGANALQSQASQAKAQMQQQGMNSLMGGLFNLGSAGITKYSDARLKRDIRKIGERADGLGIYLYRYIWSKAWEIGAMAQEVAAVRPLAVTSDADGFLMVRYGAL